MRRGDDGRLANVLAHANRRGIRRQRERAAQCDLPGVIVAVVGGPPDSAPTHHFDGIVVDHRRWRHPGEQCRLVHERLEGGARLTLGKERAIEATADGLVRAAPRHQSANVSTFGRHRDKGALGGLVDMSIRIDRFPGDNCRLLGDGAIGGALQREVECGVDGDVTVLQHVGQHRVDDGPHGVEGGRLLDGRRSPLVLGDAQGLAFRRRRGRRCDKLLLGHQAKNEVPPACRDLCVTTRRVGRRRLGEGGEHRALGEGELADVLAEQVPARRLDTVHAVAEVDDV